MHIVRYIVICFMIIGLGACQPVKENEIEKPTSAALPVELSPLFSPVATATTITVPQASPSAIAPEGRFALNRPVRAGDTVVSGTGPKGTAIKLFDLTRMGIELGDGIVQDDGRFAIKVEPLPANIRIGIQLVEQDDRMWEDKTRLGPEALVVPLVGVFVDTTLVTP